MTGAPQSGPGPVTAVTRDHLVGRYGAEAADVIQLVAENASLGEPLVPGLAYLRAEAVFAARHEMAVMLDDVLATAPGLACSPAMRRLPRPRPSLS